MLLYDCASAVPNYLDLHQSLSSSSTKPTIVYPPSLPLQNTPSFSPASSSPYCQRLTDLRLRRSSLVIPPEKIALDIYAKVQRIVDTARDYGRLSVLVSDHQLDTITASVLEACESIDSVFGVSQAVENTNGFVMPAEVFIRDLNQLRDHDFSLSRLIHARQSALLTSRLSHARLDLWDQSDPDIDLLRGLVDGIRIPFHSSFVPDRATPPTSAVNKAAALAIDFGWWKLYEQGLALLTIPSQQLNDHLPSEEPLSKSPTG